jgi:hypothetical protein
MNDRRSAERRASRTTHRDQPVPTRQRRGKSSTASCRIPQWAADTPKRGTHGPERPGSARKADPARQKVGKHHGARPARRSCISKMRQNAAGRPEAKKGVKLVSDRGKFEPHVLSKNRKRQKKHSQGKTVLRFSLSCNFDDKIKKDAETQKNTMGRG